LIDHFDHWGVILFSQIKKAHDERILIIDYVGLLAEIYKYAHLAYVGGSFKQRIHNVMEPAIYGIPVLFGPKHANSYEAIKLAQNNGGIIVHDSMSMSKEIEFFITNEEKRVLLGKKAEQFSSKNTGATAKLLNRWENILGE
jgi:3-deoxy-D-manno-octulosonic-acid transferase